MAELQHKTPRKPRRTNLRRLARLAQNWRDFLCCRLFNRILAHLPRPQGCRAAAHAARDAALYLIWLCLPRCWSWGRHSAPRWPGRTRCGSWCHGSPLRCRGDTFGCGCPWAEPALHPAGRSKRHGGWQRCPPNRTLIPPAQTSRPALPPHGSWRIPIPPPCRCCSQPIPCTSAVPP